MLFNGKIPPKVKEKDQICARQVDASATRLQGYKENTRASSCIARKLLNLLNSCRYGCNPIIMDVRKQLNYYCSMQRERRTAASRLSAVMEPSRRPQISGPNASFRALPTRSSMLVNCEKDARKRRKTARAIDSTTQSRSRSNRRSKTPC